MEKGGIHRTGISRSIDVPRAPVFRNVAFAAQEPSLNGHIGLFHPVDFQPLEASYVIPPFFCGGIASTEDTRHGR